MPPIVTIDARDATAPRLRGWGRYTSCLVKALRATPDLPFELETLTHGGWGPELLFEQVKLPFRARGAALIHAPNCFLPLLRSCPGVVTIHDLAFEAWPGDFAGSTGIKYRRLTPLAARSAQRVICPSRFTAEDVTTRYGIDPEKVRVIPEAPALPLGQEEPPPGPYILGVGDLRAKKNFAALVRAFVALDGIPHRLVLAGVDAGQGARVRELAAGAPLELAGYVSDARLDALVRGADVLVHPSLYEGFGLVILEAMVRGTPVIASEAAALPETGGQAALYFRDAVELREVLGTLLADDDRRRAMAERGRAWAARFSWLQTARQTAAVYEELL